MLHQEKSGNPVFDHFFRSTDLRFAFRLCAQLVFNADGSDTSSSRKARELLPPLET
jgi:hypothetical protein